VTVGRLFWKFFLVFWLALLTAGIGVGTAVWWQRQSEGDSSPRGLRFAEPFVAAAGATLQYGGVEALRELLNGLEVLQRAIAPDSLEQAEKLVANPWFRSPVRSITADDGHTYLLFPALTQAEQPRPLLRSLFHLAQPRGIRPPPSPLLLVVAGLVASLMFSALLAWYLAKPIRKLRAAFDTAAQGELDVGVGASIGNRRDELADLGRDFDRMAGQLRRLMQAQQRLLHDVSHELRSPLARMQAAIGLAHQQPEKMGLILERIERESQRMDDLVGELLTLSRLEAGVPVQMQDEIDVGELLADIVENAGFEAAGKSIRIEYAGIGDVHLQGQYELIYRAVENVLRNAVRYGASGGTVSVDAQCDNGRRRLTIAVRDQGSGVPEEELAAIFEPFYRSGGARKEKSAGLGLSIARRAIEAHGGKICAANRPTGGLCIEMSLPLP
jgi:two-component system OmpR family sensor kinase